MQQNVSCFALDRKGGEKKKEAPSARPISKEKKKGVLIKARDLLIVFTNLKSPPVSTHARRRKGKVDKKSTSTPQRREKRRCRDCTISSLVFKPLVLDDGEKGGR